MESSVYKKIIKEGDTLHAKIIELTPSKLRKILDENPIAYIPISPIEWHGEHLPFGTDAIRAEWLIKSVWKDIGGILFPTEYCGTDGLITKDDDEYWYLETVVNQKLEGNFLVDEQHFFERVRRLVNNVKRNRFKILVMCTGHLSPQQLSVLEKIESEETSNDFHIILWHSEKIEFPRELKTEDYLHAGVEETSEMQYISPSLVDIDKLGKTDNENKLGLCDSLTKLVSSDFGKQRLHLEKKGLINLIKETFKNVNIY